MSDTDENKPAGKPGQRNRKGEQRRQKSGQPQNLKPDQLQSGEPDPPRSLEPDRQPDASEPIEATAASPDSSPAGAAADSTAAATVPVSVQTIANAYGNYTMKSLEETRSFVERLTGVRSLDKAMEVQTEFAKQACQTFVAESEKIRGLHRELTRQIFKPLESIIAKTTRDPR
jgi:phasin family protein